VRDSLSLLKRVLCKSEVPTYLLCQSDGQKRLTKMNAIHNSRHGNQFVRCAVVALNKVLCRACNITSFSPCLTGPVDYLFASRHKGLRFKSPGGYLWETGILLLALSRYIGDSDVIDHFCGLVGGGLRPELSLGPRADNVIIPLDLTQLLCPGFTLAAGLPSSITTDGVGCWGEPSVQPAISLHSYHLSLVQWTTCLLPVTRDSGSNPQGGTYVKLGFFC
jgi:hypothetical protein